MVTFSPVRPSGRSGMPPGLFSWAASVVLTSEAAVKPTAPA